MKKLLNKAFFITGTDTNAGKTEISLALMESFKRRAYQVAGMKPIACGGLTTEQGLQNEDAIRIRDAVSPEFWNRSGCETLQAQYAAVNPYMFKRPVAPHIAAEQENIEINISSIQAKFQKIKNNADVTIVEGVGGWQVPISRQQTMQDLVRELQIPVIMTVGLKLGAINHSLLTYQAIQNAGLNCCAWVATVLDPDMLCLDKNILALTEKFTCPCLAVIPHFSAPVQTSDIADSLNIDRLLSD